MFRVWHFRLIVLFAITFTLQISSPRTSYAINYLNSADQWRSFILYKSPEKAERLNRINWDYIQQTVYNMRMFAQASFCRPNQIAAQKNYAELMKLVFKGADTNVLASVLAVAVPNHELQSLYLALYSSPQLRPILSNALHLNATYEAEMGQYGCKSLWRRPSQTD